MQQYKFRGKTKTFGKWVYGSLYIEYDGTCHITYWKNELVEPENNFWEMVHEMEEVVPETVGQFIGMFDKSEREIYEGDILNCYDNAAKDITWGFDKEHIGVIENTPPCYSLKIPGKLIYDTPCIKRRENDVYLSDWCNAENIEIIGNIHEHPHLLNPAQGAVTNTMTNQFDPNEQKQQEETTNDQVQATEQQAQEDALESEGSTEG